MTRLDPIHNDTRTGSAVRGNKSTSEDKNSPNQVVALLDLSGNKERAAAWAESEFNPRAIQYINKADLKGGSARETLACVRALNPHTFVVFTSDIDMQSARGSLMLLGLLSGAREIVVADSSGRVVRRSRIGAALVEAPRLAIEMLCGYALVLPFSWLLAAVLGLAMRFRKIIRTDHAIQRRTAGQSSSCNILYIRATLSVLQEGGMSTHVEGFQGGMLALGHTLTHVEVGRTNGTPEVSGAAVGNISDRVRIAPSALVGATKALFELWNNLVFSVAAFRLFDSPRDFDFIYQRYSRFNLTGVLLSLTTGLPLALEFNGSEVWVSKHWDSIGQMPLLRQFERLNLKAADAVFVVSEAMKNSLTAEGIEDARIIVNPNGVNTEVFRPDCGGRMIREELAIDDQVVAGFVGTFGPWHGAPVFAEAARLVARQARCHFLFVGDGDERPAAERILSQLRIGAFTFTGRIPHDRVPSYLDACDILVSPHVPLADGSEFFGSPTKLFEYMAMARAIVASRLGQIADIIEDGKSGLLVEPGDVAALAGAIERLSNDKEFRMALGANARDVVETQYTWKANASRVVETMQVIVPEGERVNSRG